MATVQCLDYLGFTTMARTETNELLHGTLVALVLKTLAGGPRHGYGIAKWIETETGEAVVVEEGSLYPALYRMERRGWIEAEWGRSELGRKAKFYRITPRGRQRLTQETREWARFSVGVSRMLLA
jgi:PadR family transcriptional regulator, regulatory protein PadR